MLDNQLQLILVPWIRDRLALHGTPAIVSMANQPTQQGIEPDQPDIPGDANPQVFLTKLRDERYGHLKRESVWNEDNQEFDYTETQEYSTTYQLDARVIQDPEDVNQLTAGDYVNMCALILQSATTIEYLWNTWRIGIDRIRDIRAPYLLNDQDNHEQSPSFDFTVTHKQSMIDTVPEADPINSIIQRV